MRTRPFDFVDSQHVLERRVVRSLALDALMGLVSCYWLAILFRSGGVLSAKIDCPRVDTGESSLDSDDGSDSTKGGLR